MLREHAPLIVLAVVTAILFYLVFRNLRSLNAAVYGFDELLKSSRVDVGDVQIEEAPVVSKAATEAAPLPSATPVSKRQ